MKLIWLPVVLIIGLAAIAGYRMGQPMSETELISIAARIYLKEAPAGALATDCVAMPMAGKTGVRVTCRHSDKSEFSYNVSPHGEIFLNTLSGPQT